MMWRDRILAWGVGLAASLLPGCKGDSDPRPTDFLKDGLNVDPKVRSVAPSHYDPRNAQPAPSLTPSVTTGPQTPPTP